MLSATLTQPSNQAGGSNFSFEWSTPVIAATVALAGHFHGAGPSKRCPSLWRWLDRRRQSPHPRLTRPAPRGTPRHW